MKKTFKSIFIILCLLFVLTGCVDSTYTVKLKSNASGTINFIIGYNKQTLTSVGVSKDEINNVAKTSFKDFITVATENGFTVNEKIDDKFVGYECIKTVSNFNEDTSLIALFGNKYLKEMSNIKIEKNFLSTSFTQDAKLDLTSIRTENSNVMTSNMNIKYVVKLPGCSFDNNADEVNLLKNTLTWQLEAGKINEIYFRANTSLRYVVYIAILVIIIFTIILIFKLISRRNRNTTPSIKESKLIKAPKQQKNIIKKSKEKPMKTNKVKKKEKEKSIVVINFDEDN